MTPEHVPMGHYAEEDERAVVWIYRDRRLVAFVARRHWDEIVKSLDSKLTVVQAPKAKT